MRLVASRTSETQEVQKHKGSNAGEGKKTTSLETKVFVRKTISRTQEIGDGTWSSAGGKP